MKYFIAMFLILLSVKNIQADIYFDENEFEPLTPVPANPEQIDSAQFSISSSLDDFAQWVDAFFDDDRIFIEEAYTRLRIEQALLFEEGESARYKIRANLKINIPRFNNRVNLFVSGDDDEAGDTRTVKDAITKSSNDKENTSVGIQYFARQTRKKNFSLSAGVKLDSLEFFIGPRYRRTSVFNVWQTRFTQQARWFSKKGWQVTTRFDQERFISDRAFFRNTIEGRWREEDKGYRIQLNPTVIFKLEDNKALEYQLSNEFITEPEYTLDQSVFSIRFRQQFLRDWLYLEFQPQLGFSHDNDFDPTPGFIVRLEVLFGEIAQNQ